jgi:ParB-like chromosome segregation protein Spo0J
VQKSARQSDAISREWNVGEELAQLGRDSSPVRLRIEDLRVSESPRFNGIDISHVHMLAELDQRLPPILVHHPTMLVLDGVHRLCAARHNGAREIEAYFFRGSDEEAFRVSVRANVMHGLPLTVAERRAAAARILTCDPQLSDRSIAVTTGLSANTVAAVRRDLVDRGPSTRLGRDGRLRPLDTSEGRRIASEAMVTRPDASLRQIAREAGISVGTVRDVRRRMRAAGLPAGTDNTAGEPVPADRRAMATDVSAVLSGLSRDPSLRYTDAGRQLLRWLSSRVVTDDQRPDAIETVPLHCAELIARVARECSRTWLDLACELERRSVELDSQIAS